MYYIYVYITSGSTAVAPGRWGGVQMTFQAMLDAAAADPTSTEPLVKRTMVLTPSGVMGDAA